MAQSPRCTVPTTLAQPVVLPLPPQRTSRTPRPVRAPPGGQPGQPPPRPPFWQLPRRTAFWLGCGLSSCGLSRQRLPGRSHWQLPRRTAFWFGCGLSSCGLSSGNMREREKGRVSAVANGTHAKPWGNDLWPTFTQGFACLPLATGPHP